MNTNTTSTTSNTSSLLKDDLIGLKGKLENLEQEFEVKLTDVNQKEEKFKQIDKQIEDIVNKKDTIIKLDIGGKIFHTKMSTLFNVKDTLFYKLICTNVDKGLNFNKEIFIDRNYKFFPMILDYLRTKKYCLKGFTRYELDDFEREVNYYGLSEIQANLNKLRDEVEFIAFTSATRYSTAGTHSLADLKNRNLMGGICVQSPFNIVIELNMEHEISKIEVGGWAGNTSLWSPTNGANSKIQTSLDGVTFTDVGVIPGSFGNNIQTVNLTKSVGRFIKFQHTGYVGIGFLNILKD
jgi:hypothetical protein